MQTTLFQRLLTPTVIHDLPLRNRMIMAPMGTNFGTPDGYVTPRTIAYYAARAAGGVALVNLEITCVDMARGKGIPNQIGIDHDHFLPGLTELASAINEHGARAFVQLHHAGREAIPVHGERAVAPSEIRSPIAGREPPHALDLREIEELIGLFVAAAERARRAGFDGVELHAAHSYMLGQFLSPLSNKRDDGYGGSAANRARILIEIIRGIKHRLGNDFPVTVRLSGDEYADGGITIDDTCQVCPLLQDAGADALHVSAGGFVSSEPVTVAPATYPHGLLLNLAARVKQVVRIPVIGVGRITTPELAEEALLTAKCDLIALGRALLADPEFPNKVATGRTPEIRPCVTCMKCHNSLRVEGSQLLCANNPMTGRESEPTSTRARVPKRVLVVGGGVAGMEAARTAALNGHHVSLFEHSDELGGQLIPAAMPPYKEDLKLLRDYYVGQMSLLGVTVHLSTTPSSSSIRASNPDAVIVATGSRPRDTQIAGHDHAHVVFAEDVLRSRVSVGHRVVVIGGEMVGCETAEYLATLGKQVAIVRRGSRLAVNVIPLVRGLLLHRLDALGIVSYTEVEYVALEGRGLVITAADGRRKLIEADTIVLAAGAIPVRELADELEGDVPVVKVVGDAVEPRSLLEAIREGMEAGLGV